MTDRELMQMALDALEAAYHPDTKAGEVMEALRARLAQPESEPFEYWNAVEGWVKIDEVRQHFDTSGCGTIYKTAGEDRVPLYTAPPKKEWVGLTDLEISKIYDDCDEWEHYEYERAIEAKLKEKNA